MVEMHTSDWWDFFQASLLTLNLMPLCLEASLGDFLLFVFVLALGHFIV